MDGIRKGFTLPEILLVIGMLGVLSTIVFVSINPGEQLRRARDTDRVADIVNLDTLVTSKKYSHVRKSLGDAEIVYLSLPDSVSTCTSYTLPSLPLNWEYRCVDEDSVRNVDGTGWLPVDISGSRAMSALPLDPINDENYFYAYVVDQNDDFVFTTHLESEKKLQDTAASDNGNDDVRFERGTRISLWDETSLLLGKWELSDSGSVAKDSSFRENDGTAYNYTWLEQEDCVLGGCLSFSGSTWIDLGNLGNPDAGTIVLWFKKPNINSGAQYFLDGRGSGNWWFLQDYTSGSCADPNGNACFYGRVEAPSSSFSNDTWYHLALTTDSSESKIYVNGELISTGSSLNPDFSSVRVGTRYTNTSYFIGVMDEIIMYERTLTEQEINSLYKAQLN